MFAVLLVIHFYYLVQLFENNLIVPKVLGQAGNLPSLMIMTGVLVGVEVGDFLGLLMAMPVIATVRDIVCYVHCKILGENSYLLEEKSQTPEAISHNQPWQRLQKLRHLPPTFLQPMPKHGKPMLPFLYIKRKGDG